jgi:hypothetical protein
LHFGVFGSKSAKKMQKSKSFALSLSLSIGSEQDLNISFRDKAIKDSRFLPETRNLKKVSHFPKN